MSNSFQNEILFQKKEKKKKKIKKILAEGKRTSHKNLLLSFAIEQNNSEKNILFLYRLDPSSEFLCNPIDFSYQEEVWLWPFNTF